MKPAKQYRQLRARVQRLRSQNRTATEWSTPGTGCYEVFGQAASIYQRVPSARQAALMADELAQRNPGETLHVWSPDQQHCYEVVAQCTTAGSLDFDEQHLRALRARLDEIAKEASAQMGIDVVLRDVEAAMPDQGSLYCAGYLVVDKTDEADFELSVQHEPRGVLQFSLMIEDETEQYSVDFDTPQDMLDIVRDAFFEGWSDRTAADVIQDGLEQSVEQPMLRASRYQERDMRRNKQAGFDTDESVAVEVFDWINNSEVPYRQLQAVIKNLTRKMAADRYDAELAVKGFMYAVESGAKDYAREFGGVWHEMFPRDIRLLAAQMLRDEFEAEVDQNPQDYEQHVHKKHLPAWQERYSRDAATSTAQQDLAGTGVNQAATTSDQLLTDISYQLDWSPHAAMDLAQQVLRKAGHGHDAAALDLEAAYQDSNYNQQRVDQIVLDAVLDELGTDRNTVAQFVVDLLQEVNWSKMARAAREYFFGPDQQRYPDPYQGPAAETNNRDANVAHNQENTTMTRRPQSRRSRQRLANRVERARSRENTRTRTNTRERRAARTETKEARLERRVASLTRLLRTAERELRRTTAEEQDLQDRRNRVAEIRDRLEREHRPVRRTAARRERQNSRDRRPAARPAARRQHDREETAPRRRRASSRPDPQRREEARPAAAPKAKPAPKRATTEREAAPKVIKRKQDGKLYVRVD